MKKEFTVTSVTPNQYHKKVEVENEFERGGKKVKEKSTELEKVESKNVIAKNGHESVSFIHCDLEVNVGDVITVSVK